MSSDEQSNEGETVKRDIHAVLLDALTWMARWDERDGGVIEEAPGEWVVWSRSDLRDGRRTTYHGNLGQVVIEYMNLDGPGDPLPMPPYTTRECDALLAIAQAYSDWVEADNE